MSITATVGSHAVGDGQNLLVIAGPCVLEDLEGAQRIADHLKRVTVDLPVNLVFKASFDKANRTNVKAFRGVGLDEVCGRSNSDRGRVRWVYG